MTNSSSVTFVAFCCDFSKIKPALIAHAKANEKLMERWKSYCLEFPNHSEEDAAFLRWLKSEADTTFAPLSWIADQSDGDLFGYPVTSIIGNPDFFCSVPEIKERVAKVINEKTGSNLTGADISLVEEGWYDG